jgi:hypothetical protein
MGRLIACVVCGEREERSPTTRNVLFCTECNRRHLTEGAKAIAQVGRAVRAGALPKLSDLACIDCGSDAAVYDHRDYTKPLDVEPVCVRCNAGRGPAFNSAYRESDPT